jgi:hypothetical protein
MTPLLLIAGGSVLLVGGALAYLRAPKVTWGNRWGDPDPEVLA